MKLCISVILSRLIILLKKVIELNSVNNTNSNQINSTINQQANTNNTSNPIIDITESIANSSGNITLIVIIIVCVVSLCCLSCLVYTCYRCNKNNNTPYPGMILPMQIPNNECIRDNPINNTLSNSMVRKLTYITPVKENRYISYERPYECQRSHTMTYFDDDHFPRRCYADRNFTEIPSRRIKYIEY